MEDGGVAPPFPAARRGWCFLQGRVFVGGVLDSVQNAVDLVAGELKLPHRVPRVHSGSKRGGFFDLVVAVEVVFKRFVKGGVESGAEIVIKIAGGVDEFRDRRTGAGVRPLGEDFFEGFAFLRRHFVSHFGFPLIFVFVFVFVLAWFPLLLCHSYSRKFIQDKRKN